MTQATLTQAALPAIAALAALFSAGLCVALRPLLLRYALARPNARSSHRVPTPQGGGIAVLAGAVLALALTGGLAGLGPVIAAAIALAVVGAWDDIRPLSPGLRLTLQAVCVATLLLSAPEIRLIETIPLPLERGLALLAGLWFVNLVNFMDGLDWLTVAGLLPLMGAMALAGPAGWLPPEEAALAAALAGALIGFAPFNRPVAKLFLGDVGALPLGLLAAWLLYRLAGAGALLPATILPLYHVLDASVTLLRRLARGERVWEAHRSHFYQQATVNGFSVTGVVGRIAALNLVLIALAALALHLPLSGQLGCLGLGIGLTALLLRHFARPHVAGPRHG